MQNQSEQCGGGNSAARLVSPWKLGKNYRSHKQPSPIMGLKTFLIRRGLPGMVARDAGKLYKQLEATYPNMTPEYISVGICGLKNLLPMGNILEVVYTIISQHADHPFEVSTEYGLAVEVIVAEELAKQGVPVALINQCRIEIPPSGHRNRH